MRRPPPFVWVGLVLAVVALSGCGDNKSEAEKWADKVCSSIGDWRQELSSTRTDLTEKAQNGTLTINELKAGLNSAMSQTKTLAGDLRSAGPPKTEAGNEARQKLNSVVSTAENAIDSARSQAQSAGSLPAAIASVAPGLTQAVATVTSQLQQISQLDPQGELGKAIDDTKSCQDLRK